MNLRSLAPACLVLFSVALLPAQQVTVVGTDYKRGDPGANEQNETRTAPGWIADPTSKGTVKGVVASWANGASKAEQKEARASASAKLLETFKLPVGTRVKEANLWVDPTANKTYVLLTAR